MPDVEFSDTGRPVRVRYPMSGRNWTEVVEVSETAPKVVEQSQTHFIVEYASRATLECELERFEGMVEYRELPE
jgi:hypothetical protein